MWKKIFSFCLQGYDNCIKEYFRKFYTWFTLDTTIIYSWLNKIYSNKRNESIYTSTNFMLKQNGFFCNFMSTLGKWILNVSSFALIAQNTSDNSKNYNWKGSFDFIIWNLLINRSCFSRYGNHITYEPKSLKLSLFNYHRFLKYNYWKLNYKIVSLRSEYSFNYLKTRAKRNIKSSNYIGFKIQCLGRFSRRQRATCYTYRLGSMPLNKYRANIDYGNFIVPIRNSAISIKVWLYLHNPLKYTLLNYPFK
jgi:hypothetical protein